MCKDQWAESHERWKPPPPHTHTHTHTRFGLTSCCARDFWRSCVCVFVCFVLQNGSFTSSVTTAREGGSVAHSESNRLFLFSPLFSFVLLLSLLCVCVCIVSSHLSKNKGASIRFETPLCLAWQALTRLFFFCFPFYFTIFFFCCCFTFFFLFFVVVLLSFFFSLVIYILFVIHHWP